MEVDIEATTDSFRKGAVLWRWILKRQPTDSFRMVAVSARKNVYLNIDFFFT